MKSIFLKRGKEESLRRFHPWIFSGAIHHMSEEPEEGEVVQVFTSEDEYIATGHYQIGSIMVRVLTFSGETIDQSFYERKLAIALDVRRSIGLAPSTRSATENTPCTNAFRLVHGEGDNLP